MKTLYHYEIMDGILDAYKAEEMAEDLRLSSEEDAAETWFRDVLQEAEWSKGPFPKWQNFIRDIEKNIALHYDYGAGYYFIIRRTEKPE